MNYILIRAYPKDDWMAALCYHSFKRQDIDGKYIFFSEEGNYEYIKSINEEIWYREECKNFCGHKGAEVMVSGFRKISEFIRDDDYAIVSDTDIVMRKNPFNILKNDFDFAGLGDKNKHAIFHISGQFQIIKGWVIKKISALSAQEILNYCHKAEQWLKSMNDDTFISIIAYEWKLKIEEIGKLNIWQHYKTYKYANNKYDFEKTLNQIEQEK